MLKIGLFLTLLWTFALGSENNFMIFSQNGDKLFLYQEKNILQKAYLKSKEKNIKCKIDGSKIQCENKRFNLKKNVLYSDNKRLKRISTFAFTPLKIESFYDKNDKKNNAITLDILCSKNAQNVLNAFYGVDFTCKNAKKVFAKSAKELSHKGMSESCAAQFGESFEKCIKDSIFLETRSDTLRYFDENIFVFDRVDYFFSGGAHGISSKKGSIFTKNGEQVFLEKIIDFENLNLKKNLWEKYQKSMQKLGLKESFVEYEDFFVSKTLSLDENGVVFIYQPYEVLPYSFGIVELSVNFDEIVDFGDFKRSKIAYLFEK